LKIDSGTQEATLVPSFVPALTPPGEVREACWFAFRRDELLVRIDGAAAIVPRGPDCPTPTLRRQYLGALDGTPCFSAELDASTEPPSGFTFSGLRGLYGRLSPETLEVAGLASQIAHWDRTHQRCGACGGATYVKPSDRARRCDACDLDVYPRVHPAIIVLVHDGDRVLMTRQPRFPRGMYGLVAGFVEPGETLEQCVRREVLEETGVRVDQVRYFGSQPWPFPHQMMVGFFARYTSGELVVDRDELEDAQWFARDRLPSLPPRVSIARALIEAWLDEARAT
jgi:NAD+ diphosphatase